MEAKEKFMERAIELAQESANEGGFAVGAVVVRGDDIIAEGKTKLVGEIDPTLHAEINAIRSACKSLNNYYLENCILYTTHEPCPMCVSAAIWAKMKGIVFGASIEDAKLAENKKIKYRQINLKAKEVAIKGNPQIEIVENFCRDKCLKLFDLTE